LHFPRDLGPAPLRGDLDASTTRTTTAADRGHAVDRELPTAHGRDPLEGAAVHPLERLGLPVRRGPGGLEDTVVVLVGLHNKVIRGREVAGPEQVDLVRAE